MIKIFKSKYSRNIFIEGVAHGEADDFIYVRNGDKFIIDRINTKVKEVNNVHYSKFSKEDGSAFSDADEFEDYLAETFTDDFLLPYYRFIKGVQPVLNDTGALYDLPSLDFEIKDAGSYEVSVSYIWSYDSTSGDIIVESNLTKHDNSVSEVLSHVEEPQDSNGVGVNLIDVTGQNDNTGTDQKRPEKFIETFDLQPGNHSVDFAFRGTQAGAEATVYKYQISIKRVL